MLKKIILSGKRITLKQIINCVNNVTTGYDWSLYDFDGVLKNSSSFDVRVISNYACNTKFGFQISEEVLNSLINDIEQVCNLILVAKNKENKFSRYEDTDDWKKKYDITVELLDAGDDWEIYTPDNEIFEEISQLTSLS